MARRTLEPAGSPYRQARLVVLSSGSVWLWVGEAGAAHIAASSAKLAALEAEPGAEFWDGAAFPTDASLPLGLRRIGA